MLKLYIFIFCFISYFTAIAQCPPAGDITFASQDQINNFNTSYAACNTLTVEGDLIIEGPNIVDLSPLRIIKSVTGSLYIGNNSLLSSIAGLDGISGTLGNIEIYNNPELTGFIGLEGVTTLTGYLAITNNSLVTSIAGFDGLTSIANEFLISRNAELIDLSGLEKLKSAGDVLINVNPKLESLNGITLLETAGGIEIDFNEILTDISALGNVNGVIINDILIQSNPLLTNINALSKITAVSGSVEILENDLLENIEGLENLTSVGEDFNINFNPALTSLDGLEKLETVTGLFSISFNSTLAGASSLSAFTGAGNLTISFNTSLTQLPAFPKMTAAPGDITLLINPLIQNLEGLSNLKTVSGLLLINANVSVTDLQGLRNLESVGTSLAIGNMFGLTSLAGLENLTSIGEELSLFNNEVLTDISALNNVTTISGLSIYGNTALSTCNIESVCAYLKESAFEAVIQDNETNCADIDAVIQACSALPVKLISFTAKKNEMNQASLSWTTASEVNSDHFEIQFRTASDHTWKMLTSVSAKNAGTHDAHYTFVHETPVNGENLYRLKMIDTDGSFALSGIVSLNFQHVANQLSIFPNPVDGKVFIRNNHSSTLYKTAVFNDAGKKIHDSVKPVDEVDLTKFPSGFYFLQLTDSSGKTEVRKVFRQ